MQRAAAHALPVALTPSTLQPSASPPRRSLYPPPPPPPAGEAKPPAEQVADLAAKLQQRLQEYINRWAGVAA